MVDHLERVAVIAFYATALFQGARAFRVVQLRGRKVSATVIMAISAVWIAFYLSLIVMDVSANDSIWPLLSRFAHYFTAAMLFAQASMMLDVERGIAEAQQRFVDG
jgi:hypothetical protein